MSEGDGARGLVIGIGNALRGDDAVGLLAARRARELAGPGVEVLELEGEPVDLIGAWQGAAAVTVLDGVRSGAEPGAVVVHDASTPLPPTLTAASTHALGLAEAIELARSLGRLPGRLVVIGVEILDVSPGAPITPAVRAAVDQAAAEALAFLSRPART